MKQIAENADDNVSKILVGNKCDLIDQREVDDQEKEELAN